MKNPVLDKIVAFAIKELQGAYGYCGSASADNFTLLNSGKVTDIRIEIKEENG